MDLLHKDSGLLHVLPAMVDGLYRWGTVEDVLEEFIEASVVLLEGRVPELQDKLRAIKRAISQEQRQKEQKELKQKEDAAMDEKEEGKMCVASEEKQWEVLARVAVDQPADPTKGGGSSSVVMVPLISSNASIVLSSVFGGMFTETLQILSQPHNVQVCSWGGSAEDYFTKGTNNVIVKVKDCSTPSQVKDKAFVQYVESQIDSLLRQMGMTFANNILQPMAAKPKPHHTEKEDTARLTPGTYYHVDLFNWYCSCDTYDQGYYTDWLNDEAVDVTATSAVNSELIKFDTFSPIPVCPHLMAVFIIRSHHKLPLYTFTHTIDFSCI